MRVSTSQIFDTGTYGVQVNQSALYKTQNQLSTGRRVLTPADDPVSASQALVVSQSKEVNTQYLDNQGAAESQLKQVDANLGSVTDELKSIYERAIQAGNGALGVGERNMIATELKSRLDNLLSLANAQDGNGEYLYSGFQTQVPPFALTGTPVGAPPLSPEYSLADPYVRYNGDEGVRKLQVDSTVDMAINTPGSEVFMRIKDGAGNLTGRSVFDSVQNLVNALQQPALVQADYTQALGDIMASVDSVSQVRSTVGARLNALDGLASKGQDLDLQYQQRLSDLQDLDYAKAISDLNRQQLQLEAAQKSFAQTSQLSLFNVL